MKNCINGAKRLIDKQVKDNRISLFGVSFSEYHKSYYWTNENVKAYLDLVSYEGKNNALSVLASGDQVFGLVQKGIQNIDTFDSNRLTDFYALGLKRAMILKYEYNDFLKVIAMLCDETTSLECLTDIINDLLPYMDDRYRMFWKEVINYNYLIQKEHGTSLNLLQMLCVNVMPRIPISHNDYLMSVENYNELRKKLETAHITFKCANAFRLNEAFKGKYDFILLSNILDYFDKYWGRGWTYERLREYEKRLESITKKDGLVFLQYIFGTPFIDKKEFLIDESRVTQRSLSDEKVIYFPSEIENITEGIILKRFK